MRTKQRRPVVRALISVAAVAASMLVLSPTPALADVCTGHSQPGVTITVGGNPVRVPAIEVEVCRDTATTGLMPTPRVYTSGYPCETSCLAIVLDYACCNSADQTVTVSYSIDGSGTSRTVDLPIPGGGTDTCLFGVGFPDPPRSSCFISIDPDF